jgi:general secretion pathway protein D
MENPKRLIPSRGRAALLATACLIAPLHAGEPAEQSSLVTKELAKRSAALQEAQELLLKGDESYNSGKYAEAVEAFSGAHSLIPDAPATAELRKAAAQRYAQAAVQRGRELSRKGDVAGAKVLVDKVLVEEVAPGDPLALDFRAQLDDPIRTNPAADAAHGAMVDEVRRLLYTAEGAFNLGKYDDAKANYEKVLRADPYNSAARRGLERVASAKSGYLQSAYDHTRAELLADVSAAWELPLTPLPFNPGVFGPGMSGNTEIMISAKLDQIIIPRVAFDQVTLTEAIDFLRGKAGEITEGPLSGVNFTVNLGDKASQIGTQRFDLQLSGVPMSQVLKYITDMTRTSYSTDEYSVIIQPLGGVSNRLITRNHKVPPNFLSSLSSAAPAGGTAAVDPFASAPADGGSLLSKRMGAKEALIAQGVPFPDGSSVNFIAATNTLRVINTEDAQKVIEDIIATTVQAEPVNVLVRVTMMTMDQRNAEELGFDWTVNSFGISENHAFLSGGSTGSGGSLADVPVTPGTIAGVPILPGPQPPVTAGNRSGQQAISGDSIDDIIALGNSRLTDAQRAPGILRVTGIFNGSEASMLMRGLSQRKGTDVMARPSTVVRNGQQSSFRAINEFIYPTEYEPPEIPQTISATEIYLNGVYIGSQGINSFPVTPSTPTAFEMREVGVILDVLPTADANKQYVELVLNPSIVEFDGFVNYGTPINSPVGTGTIEVTPNAILAPVFRTQRVTIPSLTVYDGSTILIGGLLQQSVQNVEDKTPILGDLPVVGRLFQSKAKQPMSKAVFFFVNVQLIDPTGRPFKDAP